ncbi:MAG: heme exporter protein CcmD [Gammaproteobacteria bacterium RIFCSPLOWO2_02_FULL_61_13]|nr:MAG: heme exporter protein CcmD [Gammaproteobacteria bacterium RIFCSPLOWO2_02_FULL_61_13]
MNSLGEFLHMGGYGLYVWGAYGLSAAILIWNAIVPTQREKSLLRELAARSNGRSGP